MRATWIAVARAALFALIAAAFAPIASAYNGPDDPGNSGNEVSNGEEPEPR